MKCNVCNNVAHFKCAQCGTATVYCGESCQRLDWSKHVDICGRVRIPGESDDAYASRQAREADERRLKRNESARRRRTEKNQVAVVAAMPTSLEEMSAGFKAGRFSMEQIRNKLSELWENETRGVAPIATVAGQGVYAIVEDIADDYNSGDSDRPQASDFMLVYDLNATKMLGPLALTHQNIDRLYTEERGYVTLYAK